MTSEKTSVAILGSGISGLTAAYFLNKSGINITIYEKENYPGGVIRSHQSGGWLTESGPNTMLVKEQQIWNLLEELELTEAIIEPGPEAKKRYIIRDGELCPVPMSVIDFLSSSLITLPAKLRLLKEPFISAPPVDDESIAAFVRRRLGREPLDYGVNPLVSGIYAGDPQKLSVKHTFSSLFEMEQEHGSITKGFLKREKKKDSPRRALISFKDGLQTLPRALASQLNKSIHFNAAVQNIQKTETGWQVETTESLQNHSAVVSTVPAHLLSHIWGDEQSTQAVQQLADINYVPMRVLGLGFKRSQVAHPLDGFGMLIPEKENRNLLGCLFSSSLFTGRAPDGHVLLTCFIGGARKPELAKMSAESLMEKILPELDDLIDVSGAPVFHHHTIWEQAIPQYTVGYDTYLQSMNRLEENNHGLFLAGNYRNGVSVPDCILNGIEMADRIKTYSS